jgi:hypothetical protein
MLVDHRLERILLAQRRRELRAQRVQIALGCVFFRALVFDLSAELLNLGAQ